MTSVFFQVVNKFTLSVLRLTAEDRDILLGNKLFAYAAYLCLENLFILE